ncbi:C-type lectin domain family 10 member A-like [Osmerus eperlanus]|uniref:C-type lectin domain family 10 member A-like n=1 Tax=Osmerus eperlanus TaxID=29151 RepID=UPI002E106C9A
MSMFRGKGSPRSYYPLLTVGLGVLNAILLVATIILSVNCYKGGEKNLPLHQNITQINRKLKQLQTNNSDVIHEKETIHRKLDEVVMDHQQIRLKVEQLRSQNDILQVQTDHLLDEKKQLLSSMSTLEGNCGLCLPGWDLHKSMCYYFATSDYPLLSWKSSRDDCISRGAELVVIDSREKQLYITETLLAINFNLRNVYHAGFHIGLSEEYTRGTWGSQGTWTWVHGAKLLEGFWMDGEPNDADGAEDCAATYPTRNPQKAWNDIPCSHRLKWICEMAPPY